MTQLPYTTSEIVQRGRDWYERKIVREIDLDQDRGKALFIDIETGDYDLGEGDELAPAHRLKARNPGAILYAMRVGFPTFAKIGGGWGFLSCRPQRTQTAHLC